MARQPKPFLHRGWYKTKAGGGETRLCREEDGPEAAQTALLEHLLRLRRGESKPCSQITVEDLCNRFLDHVELNRAPSTYSDYKNGLSKFVSLYAIKRAQDVTRLDVEDFREHLIRKKKLGPKTINNALIALRRAWNWGREMELLSKNPFKNVELLYTEGRKRLMTEEEFQRLCDCASPLFQNVLTVMRNTSCRPQEIRLLTWDMVDWKNEVWIIHQHKSSRTAKVKRPRVIPMVPVVKKLLCELAQDQDPNQPFVFLNHKGKPWTRYALDLRMRRCREKAKIPPDHNGEQLVLYTNRHTYLTNAARSGSISTPLLAELAGHTDIRMTQQYIHTNVTDLHRAAREATKKSDQEK